MIMKQQQRKKQPAHVKELLLEAAGAIAAARGVEAITLEGVARDAGVSKGGLLHHFPSRRALIEAACGALLAQWDEGIARLMATDPVAEGRFSRAYIRSVLADAEDVSNIRLVGAFIMAMATDADLRMQWVLWLEKYLACEGGDEKSVKRYLARAGADGVWLADYAGAPVPEGALRQEMVRGLLDMTL